MELYIALIFGIVFGVLIQRSGFCMATGLSEIFAGAGRRIKKMWLLIILISMIGFYLVASLGLVEQVWTVPLRASGLFNIIGGFVFGVGMILAGGCAVGTLYKIGEGSINSLIALVGIIGGAWLYLTFLAPSLEAMYAHQKLTIPGILGISPWILIALVLVGGTIYLAKTAAQKKE